MKPHESDFLHVCGGSLGAIISADGGHAIIAAFVGLATGCYMLLRGIREYVKLRQDLKNSIPVKTQKQNDENDTE